MNRDWRECIIAARGIFKGVFVRLYMLCAHARAHLEYVNKLEIITNYTTLRAWAKNFTFPEARTIATTPREERMFSFIFFTA